MQFYSKLLFILFLCFFFTEGTKAIEEHEPTVSLNVKQRPLREVFNEITRQTGMSFSYESSLLAKVPREITFRSVNEPLSVTLKRLFTMIPLNYRVIGKYIILKKKSNKITISGFVSDKYSMESLAGASVYEFKTRKGTTSNGSGFFSLTMEEGETELEVSYVGYQRYKLHFPYLRKDTVIRIPMITNERLQEVVVIGNQAVQEPVLTPQMGSLKLSQHTVKSIPAMFGEADIIKTLQTFPGVSAGIAGLAGMYVRGGNGDENLYLIDGHPLYQVNHIGGLFSAFNSDVVKDIDFYKSAFPARYGGRLSSVVDVHTKDGNMREYHGSAMLGLTSGALSLEGPLVKDKTSFSIALRRSWLDVLSAPAVAILNATKQEGDSKLIARYAFTDLNVKVNHNFNTRSRAYAGLYFGQDFLKGGSKEKWEGEETKDVSKLRWGNLVAFAGWSYVFGNKLFGDINASYTRYASTLKREYTETSAEESLRNTSSTGNGINDVSLRAKFDYMPVQAHHIRFGGDYTYHRFHPEYTESRSSDMNVSSMKTGSGILGAHEAGLYVEDDWELSHIFRLNAGLRLGVFNIGKKTYASLEPRFAIRSLLSPSFSLKASYARMHQYIHQVGESYIDLPTDTWLPVSKNIKPQMSDQVSLGAYYNLNNKYSFSVEGYYKWMHNILDYKDGYNFLPSFVGWEQKMAVGKGRVYGVELTARKETGKVTGWIGYGLMWADRQFPEINGGKRFPAKFDNRHKLNIVANWKVSKKVELTGSWTYMTGNRVTVSFENYQYLGQTHNSATVPNYTPSGALNPPYMDDTGLSYYTERNNYRLPAYHRLDLGINIYCPKKKGRMGIWNVSIYNVYSYMAPVAIHKRIWYKPNSEGYYEGSGYYPENRTDCYFEKLGLIPIVPSVSYTYKF